jgi:glutaredoxin
MATRKLKSEGLMMKPNYSKVKKNKKINQIKVPYTYVNGTFIGIYYCEYYSLAAKYLSASSAAIHPYLQR